MKQEMWLAPHEALELHEIIRSELTVVTKLQASLGLVKDPDIKTFMQTTLQTKQDVIRQYQDLYNSKTQRH